MPWYLPRSFYINWTSSSSRNILQILTHSLTERTPELLLKNFCDARPGVNSNLTTQFHLPKLSKWREEILKILLFVPLQTEDHFLFKRTAGVQHLWVLLDSVTKAVIFPKLNEIYYSVLKNAP